MAMKTGARLFALLFLCPAAGAASADQASEALIKSFIDRIDKHDAWSASATRISSEGSTTIVDGLKIAGNDGSANLDAATIRLDKLAETADGGVILDGFTANGLKLSGGPWTFTIPEASGRAIMATGFSGWSFDPKAPFTSLARLYAGLAKSEFEEIKIPRAEFSQEIVIPGSATKTMATASYSNFSLSGLKKGMLASQRVERVESTTGGATPEPASTVIEGISARNLDLGALAHVLDPSAYVGGKGDGLWKMALGDARYGKITIKTGGRDTMTVGPISTGQWQVRQTPEPFAPLFDELLASGEPDDAKLGKFMGDHVAALLGWFKIGTTSLKDFAAYPPEGGKIALASATVEDLSAESMTRFAFEGFSGNSPALAIRFQKFELSDVVWPSISGIVALAKLQEAKNAGAAPDQQLVDKAASESINLLPRVGKLSMIGLEAGVPGGEPFKMDEYTATSEGGTALLPKTSRAKIGAIVIPRGLLRITPESANVFDSLGYGELVIDGEGEANHDEASGRYSGQGRLTVKDAGALSLSDAVGGVTNERMKALMMSFAMSPNGEPNEAQLLAAAGPISIESFTLRFDDASLTKRVLPLAAKMQGTDEATLVGNITAMIQLGLAPLGNQAFTTEVVNSVGAFLKEPKSLTVALRPAHPVMIQQLLGLDPSKPGAAIDLLGVHVTAND